MIIVPFRCSKRSPRKQKTDRQSNDNTNTHFDNPAFDQASIYDSVSKASGSSMAPSLAEMSKRGSQDLRHQSDGRNEMINKAPCDNTNSTYQALNHSCERSPPYSVAYSGDRGDDNSEKRYASLQQKNEKLNKEHPRRGRRMESPAKQYASFQQQKTGHPGRDGHDAMNPVYFKTETCQHSSDAATDQEIYENLKRQDESGA